MKILYGKDNKVIDITDICYNKCKYNDTICIPDNDDNRVTLFGKDPIWGTVKSIYIDNNGVLKEYDDKTTIYINTINDVITTIDRTSIVDKLSKIQKKLKLKYGTFYEELPEQKMALTYLTGNEKVLEIGGNIGRNSLIISHILGTNSSNHVVLEADEDIAHKLCENRDNNNMNFNIESSALSNKNLITRNDIMYNQYVISNSTTIENDEVPEGYKRVSKITLDELNNKYNITFDTLIIDCEGAFYYILQDFPDILTNIKLIIMENDYDDITKKEYIDKQLKLQFRQEYFESGGKGPCFANFFEVWRRLE